MVSKVFVIVAALCFAQAFAKPAGDDKIKELAEKVQGLMQTFTNELSKTFDIKESEQITQNLKTSANEFAGKLSDALTHVGKEAEAHKGDANAVFESLKTQVEATVKKIQDEHPAEAAKAKEYQETIKKTYTDLYTKAKEAADTIAKDTSGIQEDMHKFTEDVMKQVKVQLEKVNADIKKSIDEHQKEHKH